MEKFRIKVIQVFQVETETVVEVEAPDGDTAFDMVADGSVDLPPADSPAWKVRSKSLENEEYEPV
jgi:hypothetical protein